MSAGAWVAICIAAGVVGAIVTFLLTTWSFLPQERKLSETTPTVETFLPAHDIRSADINNPVSYTHLTLPTNREV